MGNDMVGKVIDAFEKFRPEKTVAKIWNMKDLYVILGVKDINRWEEEMDPYYVYTKGKIDGVSYIDSAKVLDKVIKKENLIYVDKAIE